MIEHILGHLLKVHNFHARDVAAALASIKTGDVSKLEIEVTLVQLYAIL